jgi:hypothetical protein
VGFAPSIIILRLSAIDELLNAQHIVLQGMFF